MADIFGSITVLVMLPVYMFQWIIFLMLLAEDFNAPETIFENRPKKLKKFMFWNALELLLVIGVAIGNFLLLAIRTLKMNRISMRVEEKVEIEAKS